MAHTHPVIDKDTQFEIDGATRLVKNVTDTKTMLVQFDHNSERFTFKVPRYVDGHDLSLCNLVRVHFINIEKSKRTQNSGIVELTDLAVCTEDEDFVTCSWLVSSNATQLAGSLHFVVQFACGEDDKILYSWNTAKHTSVTVADGIDCSEAFSDEYNDILLGWKSQLEANQITKVEQTVASTADNGENVWTVTFGDGRTQDLKVRNGSKGDVGLIGSIKTVQDSVLHFFVGTKAEYDALSEDKKQDLFAIITDETNDAIIASLNAIKEQLVTLGETDTSFSDWKNKIMNGTTSVKKAESADKATKLVNGKCICQVYFETKVSNVGDVKVSATILLNNALYKQTAGFLGFKTAFIENVRAGVCVSATGLYGTHFVLGLLHDGTNIYIRESGTNVTNPNDQVLSSVSDSNITVIYTNITE